MRRLICGCGYLGQRVALRWSAAGDVVHVLTRSAERQAEWKRRGWHAQLADICQLSSLKNLPQVDSVLFAVSPQRQLGGSFQEVFVQGFQNLLKALPGPPRRLVLTSSTGVYGQREGEWVTEPSACCPATGGGEACFRAERLLDQDGWREVGLVLRLAGIYGPGRVPHQKLLEQGQEVPVAAEGWLNLVHVEDAASVVVAVSDGTLPHRVYNVSDGHPVRRGEFYHFWTQLHGWPPPQFVPPDPSSPAAQRALSSKRVDSSLLRCEVSVNWQYPSYREGLAAIAHGGDDSRG